MGVGLNVKVEEKAGKKVVHLEGRLDATSTPQLEDQIGGLIGAGGKHFVIDFARVEYLSSAGMRLMLSNTKRLKAEQGSFRFCSISDEVMEIIKMAGFEKILSIYASEQEALEATG